MMRLVQTCGACPEQYDAFVGGEQVGYLRLRHGVFTVSVPDAGGRDILTLYPAGDGAFYPEERQGFLDQAVMAILASMGPIYEVTYE